MHFARSLLFFVLLFFAVHAASASGDKLPPDGKLEVGKAYGSLKFESLNDLDDVVLTDGKQSIHVALASVLPLAGWPRDAATEKLKIEILQQLKTGLNAKEVSYLALGVDEKGGFVGDLTLWHVGFGSENWKSELPSGGVGWGGTSINILLIERGYSPYVKRVYEHRRGPVYVWELFDRAEELAKEEQVGFCTLKDAARSIESKASGLSNECVLSMRGLEWSQSMTIARQLISLPDSKIRHSLVWTMQKVSYTNKQRLEWSELLLERYFEEPELVIRRDVLSMLYAGSGLPVEKARPFVEQVLETETDKELRDMANFWQKRLK